MSLLNLIHFLNTKHINFVIDFTGNESLIPRARNNSLGKFKNSDCTVPLSLSKPITLPKVLLKIEQSSSV